MKDNMLSYEYKPDNMNVIKPAPNYPTKALNSNKDLNRDNSFNLERKRTAGLTKRQNDNRFSMGRLYSHIKLEQIKTSV